MGLGELIYTKERASGEAISKVESHTPKIELLGEAKKGEPLRVRVSVGPHPNKVEHSIRWIELYYEEEGRAFNPILVGRAFFAPGYAEPIAEFTLRLEKPGTLHALAYCNLHGLWESSLKVEPK